MTTEVKLDQDQGARLNIELGCQLSIQVEEMKERLTSYLVGMLINSYLIIKTPSIVGIKDLLTKGSSVVVRYIYLGEVFGFRSTVLGSTTSPFKIIFLSYPKIIEIINLRQKPRISCCIPASLNYKNSELKGIIENINSGGCKFTTQDAEHPKAQQIWVEDNIQISFPLFGLEGIKECNGIIRNKNCGGKRIELGIEFEKMDSEISNMIDSYVEKVKKHVEDS